MNLTALPTMEARRRWLGPVVVSILFAVVSGVLVTATPATAASIRQRIVNTATDQLGGKGCDPGYYNSCGINWCAEFARWVWAKSGVPDVRGLNSWAQSFKDYGIDRDLYHRRSSGYDPQPGDAIVFDWDHDPGDDHPIDHVAIVTSVSGGQVHTIGGNQDGSDFYNSVVSRASYSLGNGDIDGYVEPSGADGRRSHDFNEDGRDDIAMMYGREGGYASVELFTSMGSSFKHTKPWHVDSGYDVTKVGDRITAGDFNNDGRADLAAAYDYGQGAARIHVWLGGSDYKGSTGWWAADSGYTLNAVNGRMN